MQKEAELFMASHLSELNYVEDEFERITTALATISAINPQLSETYLTMMISQIDVSNEVLLSAICYFRGANFLAVYCDCFFDQAECLLDSSYYYNQWFDRGLSDKQSNNIMYNSTKSWIDSLRSKLLIN